MSNTSNNVSSEFGIYPPVSSPPSLDGFGEFFFFFQIINMINLNQVAGVDNTFRRKFDREEYLERARERERQVRC